MPVVGFLSRSPEATQHSSPDSAKGLVKPAMSRAGTWRSNTAGRTAKRSAAGIGGGSSKPAGDRHRGNRRSSRSARGQSRDLDDSDRVRDGSRSSPVGLVDSLNRPGGNVTGITSINMGLAAKQSGFCSNSCTETRALRYWSIPKIPQTQSVIADVQAAARQSGSRSRS